MKNHTYFIMNDSLATKLHCNRITCFYTDDKEANVFCRSLEEKGYKLGKDFLVVTREVSDDPAINRYLLEQLMERIYNIYIPMVNL